MGGKWAELAQKTYDDISKRKQMQKVKSEEDYKNMVYERKAKHLRRKSKHMYQSKQF